jgi:hypothetical protein
MITGATRRCRVPSRKARDSFDGAAFLTAKVEALDSALAELREREKDLENQRDRITAELHELTESISEAEAERSGFQHTLAQLTNAGPEARGSHRANTSDDAEQEGGQAAATAFDGTLADKIRALMAADPSKEWAMKDLGAEFPRVHDKVLSNTILRMYKRGQVDRVRIGQYRLPRTQAN